MRAIEQAEIGSSSPWDAESDIARPRVLLVDDQPARLLTYESVLEGVGVQCVRARSAREALARLSRGPFALVLLDISTPGTDGYETARLMRQHPEFGTTPFLFVTAVHPSELDTLRGYEAGAIDYIQVPVVPEILRSKVALLVELHRRRAELERLNRELADARAKLERERERQAETSVLKVREQRSAALLRLGDSFRALAGPDELAYAAARILGETLGVSRCGYGTLDVETATVRIEREWTAPGVSALPGTLHLREFGTHIDELKRGETVVCEDAENDPRTQATVAALKAISAHSFVNMPAMEQDKAVALFYLSHFEPRHWPADELSLMREFADRTRVAVERRKSDQAVAADLRDTRLLRDVAARLIAGDGQAVIEDILSAAMSITEADCGTVQLLEDDEPRTLVFIATRNAPPELKTYFARVDASSHSPCGVALARGTRVAMHFDVPEIDDPDGSLRLHLENGLQSGQSTPLITRSGRPLGMFSTHWRVRRVLTEREERFLDLLARQAADVIERVQSAHALREADRRKDEFIAVLAHELRNPLVPIRTGVELLKRAAGQPEILEKLPPMMERQVRHMVRLIDDLLDVSRITSGKITLQRQRISLSAALAPALDANREALNSGGFDFSVSLSDPQYVLDVDPTRFAQVVSNLLQNATKFTPQGGSISLSSAVSKAAEGGADTVTISISDTGVGIPAATLPGIFVLFQHRGHKHDAPQSGLGIGLALSRSLIEMHGGTLVAQSDGEGAGSLFTITLPGANGLQLPEEQTGAQAQVLAGCRVLLVDDNKDAADAMAMLITRMGAETRVAYDGASGLEQVNDFSPQVAILDIGMPGMSGYEVCRRIRDVHGHGLAVIALTGWGQAQDKEQALNAGFDSHLTKPPDPATLELLLARFARSHQH